MHPAEIILLLFAAVAVLAALASRIKVPYPIFLVVGGLALSFVPNLPRPALDPQVVFLVFLPPILYYAGLLTSWRDFRANARPIGLLAFGLVLFTTVLVAAAAHFWLGMSWAAGFVLGAIVSPPDAVAATAIMSRMNIPRRIIVILEGESLVNDATALVAYRFAVAAVVTGAFSLGGAAAKLVLVAVGGVAVGLVVGYVVAFIRPRLRNDDVEAMVSLLTPYLAYLPAEHVGVSGVLAAVTTGLYLSRRLPLITSSRTRIRLYSVWDVLMFILNGLVFMLIGLQLPGILERLGAYGRSTGGLISRALLISVLVVVLRMAWVYPATYLPRLLWRRLRERDPAPPAGAVFMIAWTGMRGIVSLAAALALPLTLADGRSPFPHRDLILFLTFCVILFTLVFQGLSLPLVIELLKLREDGSARGEELRARYDATQAALARLQVLVATGDAAEELVAGVRAEYERSAAYLRAQLGIRPGAGDEEPVLCETRLDVRRQALMAQQLMLVRLRDENVIGDEVLRRIQGELDLEEARLEADA